MSTRLKLKLFVFIVTLWLAAAAPGLASASKPGGLGPRVHVVNLHAAYEAELGHAKLGKIAITYARGKQPRTPKANAPKANGSCAEPRCPLVYHGGSVQHTPHIYLLFWGPDWSTDSGEQASASYLESLCQGLGVQPTPATYGDTWSWTTDQYNAGSSGRPGFNGTVCKSAFQDTSTPPYGVDPEQLATEANAFASSQGITDRTDAQIVVATQSGTCPSDFTGTSCSGSGNYCAWHSNSNEPFTNLPYMPDAESSCGEDSVNANGTNDGFSIVEGHEYAETITDPYPDSGWIDLADPSGGEIGDKCAWRNLQNVTLSTGAYAMQPLYSNSAGSCVLKTYMTLDVTTSTTGGSNPGTVTSSPSPTGEIDCGSAGSTCSQTYEPYTTVTLTASQDPPGVLFTGWNKLYGSTSPCPGMASTACTVTMNKPQSVTATYEDNATLYQETSAAYTGAWTAATCGCYSGGGLKDSTAAKASASFKFTGNSIAFVSARGPSRGSFKVYIDGVYKATVSNYSSGLQRAIIAWRGSITQGTHTLKIVNQGTGGHPRADVDAFIVGGSSSSS